MTAAIVGALIGAIGVVLRVLFGQSRQEYGRTKTRATALARDVQIIGVSLFNSLTSEATLPRGGWGADYYRFGSSLLELTDCSFAIHSSKWSGRTTKRTYAFALAALNIFDGKWAAVQVKLSRKESLSEGDIRALIVATGEVGHLLRSAAPSEPLTYIDRLRNDATFYVDNGIDAEPPKRP
jgi:hypothetical protein